MTWPSNAEYWPLVAWKLASAAWRAAFWASADCLAVWASFSRAFRSPLAWFSWSTRALSCWVAADAYFWLLARRLMSMLKMLFSVPLLALR